MCLVTNYDYGDFFSILTLWFACYCVFKLLLMFPQCALGVASGVCDVMFGYKT